MKKLMFALATIALVAGTSTFTSCKKGENDPFLSLRSRKARLTGEWTLKEGTANDSYTSGSFAGSSTTTYTETEMTTVSDGQTSVETIEKFKFTFEKDGQFEFLITTTPKSINGNPVSDPTTYSTVSNGVWAFLGANKDQDIKNREAVLLRVTSESVSLSSGTTGSVAYTGVSDGEIFMIDQLKNKELTFTIDYSRADSDGDITTGSQTFSFTKD